jgi:dipeptidyl aminopeptidase/acylaminoacyl peptidase
MKRITLFVIALVLLTALSATAMPPRLIPLEVLMGNPAKVKPRLSPDGEQMTYVAPYEGVLNIWIKTVGEDDDRPLTTDDGRGIFRYYWAKNGEYVLYLQDKDGDENHHVYAVEIETGTVRDLTPYEDVKCFIAYPEYDHPDEVVVYMNDRDPRVFDIYRLNLYTGERELIIENPGDTYGYDLDDQWVPRAYMKPTADGGTELWFRESAEDDWEKVLSWGFEDSGSTTLSFTPDGERLYLLDSRDSDTMRLVTLDPASGETEVLAEDPGYDIGGHFEFDPVTEELDLVTVQAEKLRWMPLSNDVADDVTFLESRFPDGEPLISDRSRDDETWLLTVLYADRSPETYVYDRAEKQLTKMFEVRPELNNYTLAPMIPIEYEARDGRSIEGYLTLPPGELPRNLPLVLNVHGGPWARDYWGYSPEVQLLANRGYAVLQVNYRGSSGYGKEHLHAGDKEWGGRMQDDLTDAVNWAVELGIADPERVAVYGWSYGGYAALAGATFTTADERVDVPPEEPDGYDFYRCAVSGIGPANLITFIETVPPYWTIGQESFFLRVGNPETEADFLASRSPLNYVERIEIPMLLLYGANDPRVKLSEGEQISAALEEAGVDYEYVVYENEGHGFARPENRLDAYRRVELFLAEHLGGRAE